MSNDVQVLEQSTGVTNPLVLLQSAIDRGINPDQLGKLMDLSERWEANRAKAAFAQAMSACQAEMPAVIKDAENKGCRSRYARLETVNYIIKPVYTKHGFSLSFNEVRAEASQPDHCCVEATLRHSGGHCEVYSLDLGLDGKGAQGNQNAMNVLQAKGSTIAYARRYLTLMAFNVAVAEEDNDGGNGNALITPEEVGLINDALGELESAGRKIDLKKLLAWAKVESLGDVTRPWFAKIMLHLNAKRREVAK